MNAAQKTPSEMIPTRALWREVWSHYRDLGRPYWHTRDRMALRPMGTWERIDLATACVYDNDPRRSLVRRALLLSHVSPSCDETCEGEFSWRACELCGDKRAGARHKATELVPMDTAAPAGWDKV